MRVDRDDRARILHHDLVQGLKDRGLLADRRVEDAFRSVPRHLFLPGVPLGTVYLDDAIPTKRRDGLAISSSSQPAVMAVMLEQLGLQAGDRVLEIGAGTGYNAALMAHIVGPSGTVVALDIDQDIVERARAHLDTAGFPDVQVICRDGAVGYPEAAPYDRIILTVSAWDIVPAWIEQLKAVGRLVLPLAINGTVQKLVGFERRHRSLVSVSVRDGGFMPLRGTSSGPQLHTALGPRLDLVLGVGAPRSIDTEQVYRLVTGPHYDVPTMVQATGDQLWGGVSLWLALHAPTVCSFVATGEAAERGLIPALFEGSPAFRASVGVLGETRLCLLARSTAGGMPYGLAVRCYGVEDGSVQRFIDLLDSWDRAGRPSTPGLTITAYPRNALPASLPAGQSIDKPETKFVLQW